YSSGRNVTWEDKRAGSGRRASPTRPGPFVDLFSIGRISPPTVEESGWKGYLMFGRNWLLPVSGFPWLAGPGRRSPSCGKPKFFARFLLSLSENGSRYRRVGLDLCEQLPKLLHVGRHWFPSKLEKDVVGLNARLGRRPVLLRRDYHKTLAFL